MQRKLTLHTTSSKNNQVKPFYITTLNFIQDHLLILELEAQVEPILVHNCFLPVFDPFRQEPGKF